MEIVTVSPKYQIVIPLAIRKALGLKPGQKVSLTQCDGRIELVPVRAIETYESARAVFRELGMRDSECMVLANLSFLHDELGDYETAEREAKTSLAISRETGGMQFRIAAELSLADTYIRTGRNAEARKYALMGLATGRELGMPLTYLPLQFGVLKIRGGDRETGLAWIGYTRKHDEGFKKEIAREIKRMWTELCGEFSDDETEAAMARGGDLNLEEILAQVEREGA